MVLLPAGLLFGKALSEASARKTATTTQIARTSAISYNCGTPRRRHLNTAIQRRVNPFTREEIINRMGGCSVRRCTTQSRNDIIREEKEIKEALENETWIPVYRYSNIRITVLLAKAKLLQTIGSAGYLPYSVYNYSVGHFDATWFWSTAFLAVFAPVALTLFSRYLNRLVGVIAMNESNTHVRIGYLSFWGKRRDKFLEVNDVLPLMGRGATKDSLVKLTWYSNEESYLFLATRNAEIVDNERAQILFGDTTIFTDEKKLH